MERDDIPKGGKGSPELEEDVEDRIAKATKKAERDQRLQEKNDLRSIMDTAHGRRFIWRLLGHTGVFENGFHTDPGIMAYKQGSRKIGVDLLIDIGCDFQRQYLTMQTEALKNAKKNARQVKEASGEEGTDRGEG